jgi:hypothetical protein
MLANFWPLNASEFNSKLCGFQNIICRLTLQASSMINARRWFGRLQTHLGTLPNCTFAHIGKWSPPTFVGLFIDWLCAQRWFFWDLKHWSLAGINLIDDFCNNAKLWPMTRCSSDRNHRLFHHYWIPGADFTDIHCHIYACVGQSKITSSHDREWKLHNAHNKR